MRADPVREAAQKLPRSAPEARAAAFQAMRKKHDFNEFHFNRRATYHKEKAGFLGRIGSEEAQNIGKRVYESLNDWGIGKHRRPRFKGKQRPLHSLEGKRNTGNLMWKPDLGVLQIERDWQIKILCSQSSASDRQIGIKRHAGFQHPIHQVQQLAHDRPTATIFGFMAASKRVLRAAGDGLNRSTASAGM